MFGGAEKVHYTSSIFSPIADSLSSAPPRPRGSQHHHRTFVFFSGAKLTGLDLAGVADG